MTPRLWLLDTTSRSVADLSGAEKLLFRPRLSILSLIRVERRNFGPEWAVFRRYHLSRFSGVAL